MKKTTKFLPVALLALSFAFGFTVLPRPARADNEPAPDGTQPLPCGEAIAGLSCVQGGYFLRGANDPKAPKNSKPQANIWMQTYYMDTFEVTSGDYNACVKEKKCKFSKPIYSDFSRPKQPMVAMTWYDAVQFCKARGRHLPTEAEWEKAARGPDGNLFPWGNEPVTCKRAIIMENDKRSCGVPKKGGHPEKGRTWEIGARPAGAYGIHDMSGNAWEWVADWYSKDWAACGKACLGMNPKGPCGGKEPCKGHTQRLVRGGSWYWPAKYATAIWRRPNDPANKAPNYHHFGFRCAATWEEAQALRGK